VRCDSPPSSAPSADTVVVVPDTGFGAALAATARVGGLLITVALAVPWTPEFGSVAVTVNGPPAVAPAVKRPLVSIVPPPPTTQSNVGCAAIGSPN
jgi:hypothetical protein